MGIVGRNADRRPRVSLSLTSPSDNLQTGERMTRKDYKLIAEAIRQTSEYFTDKDAFSDEMRDILIAVGMTAVVRNLQRVLAEDNPNFKSDVFYKACVL